MIKGLKAARRMRVNHSDSLACVDLGLIIFPFPGPQHTFLTPPVTQVLLGLLAEVSFVSATVSFGSYKAGKAEGFLLEVTGTEVAASVQCLLLLF